MKMMSSEPKETIEVKIDKCLTVSISPAIETGTKTIPFLLEFIVIVISVIAIPVVSIFIACRLGEKWLSVVLHFLVRVVCFHPIVVLGFFTVAICGVVLLCWIDSCYRVNSLKARGVIEKNRLDAKNGLVNTALYAMIGKAGNTTRKTESVEITMKVEGCGTDGHKSETPDGNEKHDDGKDDGEGGTA